MQTPTPLAPGLAGSVGVPHNGVLTAATELPVSGPGFVRFRPRAKAYHGLPRLVGALERAANVVFEQMPGGAPLVIGDLSEQSGGRIPRHNSHRTGRDVDLLFFITTPRGVPIKNPGFFALAEDGFVRFPDGQYGLIDLPREWLLVKTLLEDTEIDVQFLFMSRELEARIIDYALAKEDDLELVWRAETVMLQPVDSLPHADHVHMRVACRPDEAVAGCSGGGPHWPWLSPLPFLASTTGTLWAEIGATDPLLEIAPGAPALEAAPPEAAPPVEIGALRDSGQHGTGVGGDRRTAVGAEPRARDDG
jgi:penicillin-insensitive murein endopeptidase